MTVITSKEKAELLKDTIRHLYSKEGRTKSYISKLLKINRKTLNEKIGDWNLPKPKSAYHMNPSTRKRLNRYRNQIKSMLDKDYQLITIATVTKTPLKTLTGIFLQNDELLKKAYTDWQQRRNNAALKRIEDFKTKSKYLYNIVDYPDEIWKPILGFDKYYVSNHGRVKKYTERYNDFYLLQSTINKNTNRPYISLYNQNKRKNLSLSRIVAQTFIPHEEKENTVNHKDGNVDNNHVNNLEWVTQSENNKHTYRTLNRQIVNKRKYKFDKLLYRGKYEFKTVAAFARFIGKSETQTRRYIDNADEYNIKLIYNCID